MQSFLLALAFTSATAQTLETFDGSRSWSETNDPVMGGLSQATFKISGGTGVFNGTCKIVPSCVESNFRRRHRRDDDLITANCRWRGVT